MTVAQANREFYDRIFADKYEATHPRVHSSNYANRMFVTLLREIVPLTGSEEFRVLDIGCGTGGFASHVVKLFPHTTLDANDISVEMLNRFAQKLERPTQSRFTPLCMDVHEVFLEKNRYHCILIEEALHHFEDYLTIVGSACDALHPLGYLLMFNEPSSIIHRPLLGRFLRRFDSALLQLVANSVDRSRIAGFLRPLVAFVSHMLKSYYASRMSPEEFAAVVGRAQGYGLDGRGMDLFERSERHSAIDITALKQVLRSKDFHVTRELPGPDYVFGITYSIARLLGSSSHFVLLARKTMETAD